jgi:hypothetical protein
VRRGNLSRSVIRTNGREREAAKDGVWCSLNVLAENHYSTTSRSARSAASQTLRTGPPAGASSGRMSTAYLGRMKPFVAILGTIVALLGASTGGLAGLVDAALFAICGLGIWRKWRSAALVAFLLFGANLVVSVPRSGIGVATIFIFVGLLNGLRGTFARVGLLKRSQVEEAG